MLMPAWVMQAVLVFWMTVVGVAYATGASPVIGLIGVIFAASCILVRHWVVKAP